MRDVPKSGVAVVWKEQSGSVWEKDQVVSWFVYFGEGVTLRRPA